MNVRCDREKLLTAFQSAATVVPTRSPKPILQNVKFEVSQDQAILMATDMEVGIRTPVADVEVIAPGKAVFPTARFGPILRESSDEKLQIEVDGNAIRVSGERSKFRLPAENPDEYPDVVVFSEEKHHEVPARLLKELIRRTLFAADTESSRYALGGVLLEFETDKITTVGTDGRRLAKMEGPATSVGGHESGDVMTIVPSRSLQLIERTLQDADAEVQIAARANDVLVQSPRATVYSRLVEGRFPRWRDVFPSRQDGITIQLAVGPIYSALRQAAIVATEDSRGIEFTFGGGTLVLAATTADVGETRIEVPIPYDGDAVTLTLDHRYVGDFLKVLDPEGTFTLDIKDADSASLWTTEDGYAYVVMPLARDR